jgi:hypothetical protein
MDGSGSGCGISLRSSAAAPLSGTNLISSENQVTTPAIETSPQFCARVGGALYLIIIVIGLFGEVFVRDRLIVSTNAAATAANIMSHEPLWRFHIAAELFLLMCAVALLLILFVLLRPVSRDLMLLAIFFNLAAIIIEAVTTMYLIETLFPLGNAAYLKAFTAEQLNAISSLFLKSHGYGFGVSLLFFGCFCVIVGYLIFRSNYLPKAIGVLMQIGGVCYLTNSFALVLSPMVANRLFPVILVPAFIGEVSLCLWLLVKGVNIEKWHERAAA